MWNLFNELLGFRGGRWTAAGAGMGREGPADVARGIACCAGCVTNGSTMLFMASIWARDECEGRPLLCSMPAVEVDAEAAAGASLTAVEVVAGADVTAVRC